MYLTLRPISKEKNNEFGIQQKLSNTIQIDVKKQLKDKFKTFTNWNYRELSQRIKKSRRKAQLSRTQTIDNPALMKALLSMTTKKPVAKVPIVLQQLVGIKAQRRQRFKKSQNPLHFIKHYMEREGYKPNQEEMFLIERTVALKKYMEGTGLDLEQVLQRIYTLMNLAVDCNQLRLLNLLILLAADVCYQVKDYNRAFYFYNQSRVASTYANLTPLKAESLMGMGLIALNLSLLDQAIIIFKKNLQYSWDAKSTEAELMIYDYLGQCFYNQGNIKQAQYYHTRYVQGQVQNSQSAIKRISFQMLNDYKRHINSLQQDNLTSLFIQYLNLPISDFQQVPIPDKINKLHINYKNGASPRKDRNSKRFNFKDFPDVHRQIDTLIKQDFQFISQIPNPDMHRNYIVVQKFGRKRKSQQFEQSSQFHRIIGSKPTKLNFDNIYKYPLQKRIERALSQPKNPNWWQQMLSNAKKQRTQKVGILKQKIRINHLSYHKYPEERKRALSLKNQMLKESLNKTLLDWIDPVQ